MKDYASEDWDQFVGSKYISSNELDEIMEAKISEIIALVGEHRMMKGIVTKSCCGPKTWRDSLKWRTVGDLIFFAGKFFEIDKLPEDGKEIIAKFLITRLAYLETARNLCNMMTTADSLYEMYDSIQDKRVNRPEISNKGIFGDCDYSTEFDISRFHKYYGEEWNVKATELSWKNAWHSYCFTKMKEGGLPFEKYSAKRHKGIINHSMKDTLNEMDFATSLLV